MQSLKNFRQESTNEKGRKNERWVGEGTMRMRVSVETLVKEDKEAEEFIYNKKLMIWSSPT